LSDITEDGTDLVRNTRARERKKSALEIAVAGGHNIALYGPPGTGKTMLARAATAILPPLSENDMLEVTAIHSLAGRAFERKRNASTSISARRITRRATRLLSAAAPFRGPGEVTLAHRGVLFLDEFPEFHRDVVNALREPLEDAQVSVSRARGTATFPANFHAHRGTQSLPVRQIRDARMYLYAAVDRKISPQRSLALSQIGSTCGSR
jgi:magnesium chelatase family protein